MLYLICEEVINKPGDDPDDGTNNNCRYFLNLRINWCDWIDDVQSTIVILQKKTGVIRSFYFLFKRQMQLGSYSHYPAT